MCCEMILNVDSFPLPMRIGLECHPTGAVARDAGGISRSRGSAKMLERPARSRYPEQRVAHAVPQPVLAKQDVLDEDLSKPALQDPPEVGQTDPAWFGQTMERKPAGQGSARSGPVEGEGEKG